SEIEQHSPEALSDKASRPECDADILTARGGAIMKIVKSMLPLAGISRSGVAPREYLRARLQARLAAKRRAPDDVFMTIAEASSREVDEVLEALDPSREGLTEAEARLDRYGFNEVAHERPPRWYAQLPLAFKNPFTECSPLFPPPLIEGTFLLLYSLFQF